MSEQSSIEKSIADILRAHHQVPIQTMIREIMFACRLTEKQTQLLDYIKAVNYGKFMLYCEEGQPVRAEEALKSNKF